MGDPTFTLDQAMAAQKALRDILGLPPEVFPMRAFVGMISDEIERLWSIGKSDAEIATAIEHATGVAVTSDDIVRHFAEAGTRER